MRRKTWVDWKVGTQRKYIALCISLNPSSDVQYRYFLFHAALVITLCIISFPNAPDVPTWYEDVRLARSTFRERLVGDSLAARCVAILDQVVSTDDMSSGLFHDLELDKDALSNFPWSFESNELLNSFDWDLASTGF
jgi:transcriptional regulatory protein GAL4